MGWKKLCKDEYGLWGSKSIPTQLAASIQTPILEEFVVIRKELKKFSKHFKMELRLQICFTNLTEVGSFTTTL